MPRGSITVYLIDDDPSVRRALARLLRSVGFVVKVFSSAEELLLHPLPDSRCCLVLDVRMPGMNGLDLQKRLVRDDSRIPIIFITAHQDDRAVAEAMAAGATAFLQKPINDEELIGAIAESLRGESREEHGQ